ncbi:acyl carrier protein [Pseudaeromonas sp. ZJS20]|uniref:acyl carrier protein n=1 Tax=Pseudaeromonas aegiceratis TaxID=3153928 RepID=UPI00390C96E6
MDTSDAQTLIQTELYRIAPELMGSELPLNEDLRDAADLDSMDFLRLVAAVSKQTQCIIPEADYPKILTLQGFASYLSQPR